MSYYDKKENVEQYIKMAEGYDGAELIDVLKKYLAKDSHVLEIGMGAGKDLVLLSKHYKVTGSDASSLFVARFRKEYPDMDAMLLDAVTMKTERQFDGIYSNKVLYHLKREDLSQSLEKQAKILKPNGIALHSFWFGEGNDEMHGLYFAYYDESELQKIVEPFFDVLEIKRYSEMETDDSLYIVLKKRTDSKK